MTSEEQYFEDLENLENIEDVASLDVSFIPLIILNPFAGSGSLSFPLLRLKAKYV